MAKKNYNKGVFYGDSINLKQKTNYQHKKATFGNGVAFFVFNHHFLYITLRITPPAAYNGGFVFLFYFFLAGLKILKK